MRRREAAAWALVVAGIAGSAIMWQRARAMDEEVEDLTEQVEADTRQHDQDLEALEGRVKELREQAEKDSLEKIALRETERLARIRGEQRAEQARDALGRLRARIPVELQALADSVEQHFAGALEAKEEENTSLRRQLAIAERQVDSTTVLLEESLRINTELRETLREQKELADYWERKAKPPFHVKLLRDAPKYAGGALVGWLAAQG